MKLVRIPELDGIRGCAILLVIVWHYIPQQIHTPEPMTAAYFVRTASSLTWSGVDLFFVLSGFLIAGILMDNRHASNYFKVFYARRACRIFPLYFLLIGVFTLLTALGVEHRYELSWLLGDSLPLWSYATFTQNVLMAIRNDYGANLLNVTWSLAVEEQFYCFIPLLIWLLPRRMFVAIALLLVFLAPLLRVLWGGRFGIPGYVLTPWRGDSLLMGALLAVAVRDNTIFGLLRANIPILYATFIGFLGGALILTIRPSAFGDANHTWLAGLYGVFLLLAVVNPDTFVARMLRKRVFVWFGLTSYGLYMLHQATSGLVHGLMGDGVPSVESLTGCGLTFLAMVLTLVLAAASYYFFERPFLALGQRFKYMQASQARPSSQTA